MNAETRLIHSLVLSLYSKFMGWLPVSCRTVQRHALQSGPCPSSAQPCGFHLLVRMCVAAPQGQGNGWRPVCVPISACEDRRPRVQTGPIEDAETDLSARTA